MRYLDSCASSAPGSQCGASMQLALVGLQTLARIFSTLRDEVSYTAEREHSLELQIPQLVAPPAEPPRHAAQIQRVERGHLG